VNLRIKFRSENIDQFIERYAIDVSRGGIFIRTREPLAVGTVLRFDFQLQDGAPLMTGEGTVVWIREHDPTRTGVTPGMGVRFDKLSPTSQPVLDKILTDKSRREQSGLSGLTVPGATSKGGGGMAVRRPSSMFSAVDPATLGPGLPASLGGSGIGPLPGSSAGGGQPITAGSTLPFGSPARGAESSGVKPLMSTTPGQPVPPPMVPGRTPPPMPVGAGTPAPARTGAGALPTSESQSALGRLSTGNLATFGTPAAGGSSAGPRPTAPSGRITAPPMAAVVESAAKAPATPSPTLGTPSAPVAVEDSERTQIADALPDFSDETTRVGGPPLPVSAPRTTGSHAAASASGPVAVPTAVDGSGGAEASSKSSKMSLDRSVSSIDVARLSGPTGTTTPAREGVLPELPPRAKTPVPAQVREISRDGHPPVTRATAGGMAAVRPASAAAPASGSVTAPAGKRKMFGYVVAGVLAGTVVAIVIGSRMLANTDTRAPAPPEPPAPQAVALPPAAAVPPPAAAPAKPDETAPAAAPAVPPAQAADEAKAAAAAVEAKPAAPPPPAPAPAAKPDEAPAPPTAAEAAPAAPPPEKAAPAKTGAGGKKRAAGGHKRALAASGKGDEAAAAPETTPAAAPAAAAPPAEGAPAAAPAAAEAAPAAGAPAAGGAARIVKITSTPPGAEVLIDGRSVGKTPYQGKDIDPAAPHALTVKRDGFETYEHMISGSDWLKVKGVPSLKVTVKLRKARGAGGEGDGAKGEAKPEAPAGEAPAAKPDTPAADDVP